MENRLENLLNKRLWQVGVLGIALAVAACNKEPNLYCGYFKIQTEQYPFGLLATGIVPNVLGTTPSQQQFVDCVGARPDEYDFDGDGNFDETLYEASGSQADLLEYVMDQTVVDENGEKLNGDLTEGQVLTLKVGEFVFDEEEVRQEEVARQNAWLTHACGAMIGSLVAFGLGVQSASRVWRWYKADRLKKRKSRDVSHIIPLRSEFPSVPIGEDGRPIDAGHAAIIDTVIKGSEGRDRLGLND